MRLSIHTHPASFSLSRVGTHKCFPVWWRGWGFVNLCVAKGQRHSPSRPVSWSMRVRVKAAIRCILLVSHKNVYVQITREFSRTTKNICIYVQLTADLYGLVTVWTNFIHCWAMKHLQYGSGWELQNVQKQNNNVWGLYMTLAICSAMFVLVSNPGWGSWITISQRF